MHLTKLVYEYFYKLGFFCLYIKLITRNIIFTSLRMVKVVKVKIYMKEHQLNHCSQGNQQFTWCLELPRIVYQSILQSNDLIRAWTVSCLSQVIYFSAIVPSKNRRGCLCCFVFLLYDKYIYLLIYRKEEITNLTVFC